MSSQSIISLCLCAAATPASTVSGAVVTFVAVPGMTADWLQRVVDCHLARNAALGHVDPSMPECPLIPRGVTATVGSTGAGFAVAMRSDDRRRSGDPASRPFAGRAIRAPGRPLMRRCGCSPACEG